MIDYNIINISKVKIDKLSSFYKRVFAKRHRILSENWEWWYRNKYLGYESLVLISKDKVIGQAGLIPVKLKIEEKILPATWFIDFAVLPEFQNQGYGKILTEEWMKICPNQITYCNENSLRIFKKFGWKANYNTKTLAKPINLTKFLPVLKNLKLDFLDSFYKNLTKKSEIETKLLKPYSIKENYKIIFDSFNLKKNRKNSNIEICRDEEWLKWRILDCPFRKNIYFFEYKNNFAVVNIFKSKKIRRLNIIYTFCIDIDYQENLINLIFNWALNNEIDLVWANSNDTELIKKYEKIFTKKFTKKMNFASWSSDKIIHEKLNHELFDSHAVDSDNDLISMEDNSL